MSALDRFNDLSALGLVLFLTQQASIPKFLELPEPDGRVASGFRSRGGRSTSQGIELHDLFLRLANRVIAVQWDSMDGAIGKGDRRVGLSLRGQSGKPDRHEHRTTRAPCLRAVSDHRLGPGQRAEQPRGVGLHYGIM